MHRSSSTPPVPLSWGLILRFLSFYAVVVAITVVGGALLYDFEKSGYIERQLLGARHDVDLDRQFVEMELRDVFTHLFLAAQNRELRDYLESPGPATLAALEDEWTMVARETAKYDQIRFLDDTGMEIVRINYNGGKPAAVPAKELQNKAKRYYFSDAIVLKRGEIYASPFDLNIEGNAIELPHKPMIRIATPVFDRSGRKRGVVVLNYLGARMLEQLRTMRGEGTALLNSDGHWLLSPDRAQEWGFMFSDKKGLTFGAQDPTGWARMKSEESGQIVGAWGTVTFTTIRPLSISVQSSTGTAQAFAESKSKCSGREYYWKLLSVKPQSVLEKEPLRMLKRLLLFCGAVLVIGAVASWALAVAVMRRYLFQARLRQLALYDGLTGLANRTLFNDRLMQTVGEASRYGRMAALLFVDLDGFKGVNDRLGHDAGDALLKQVAERMRRSVRDTDTVARIGGDEFTVLLPEVSSPEGAATVATTLLHALRPEFDLDGRKATISASIGLCIFPTDAKDADACLIAADTAMYYAKQAGKNCIRTVSGAAVGG